MTTVIQVRCDRCGKSEDCAVPDGLRSVDKPVGWTTVAFLHNGNQEAWDICFDCHSQIVMLLTKELIHVGHAQQSGSGKTWTELGIKDKEDKDRWFEVYAFGRDLKGARG